LSQHEPANGSRLWKAPHYVCAFAGAYAVIGGLLSFLGWAAGITALTDWWGTGITIKANAALATLATGSALIGTMFLPAARRWVIAFALFAASLGGLTLFEHVTGWNLGIDTLLFDETPGSPATVAPGRMGPPASASFLTLGVALVLFTGSPRARAISSGLAFAVLAIALLSLTGYAYGAEAAYTIPRYTGIAIHTATMIAALGVGLIAAHRDSRFIRTLTEESAAGVLARRLAPPALVVPLVVGWLRVEGQRRGWYEYAFGAALRSVFEFTVLAGFLWWSVQAIRVRELRQQRAEAERRASEQRLTHTLENMSDAFVTLDAHWRFNYVNAEAERILRRRRAQLIGKDIWQVFPQVVGTPLYEAYQRAARERVTVEAEGADFETGGGRYFASRIYPGVDGGLSVYIQDITTRKQADNALREADRRKDEFLATLAHELRNPLAPIRNAASVLIRKDVPEKTLRWAAEIIGRQVQHMARLLEDLLDVSRISRNRLELRREWVDLGRVIESAVETSRPAIDAAGHELIVETPREPVYVDGDSVRLAQVFSNLLNNAAKYTERGGRITIVANVSGEEAAVRVRDTGIGIDAHVLPSVFDMFTQAAPQSPVSQGGLGIGLSLARGIVELHGGRIEAHSAGAGRGSEFIVRLPRLRESSGAAGALPAEDAASMIRRRILVVDDLRDTADTLALLLESLGHEVHAAYDGESAIEVAGKVRPEVIFMDIGMPQMSGLEACRRIRSSAWGAHTFIVAVTGWGQPQDRRQTADAGFDDHLIKPADVANVVRLLRSLSDREKGGGIAPSAL
jgi:PAS domain S-box-containing protein